MPRVGAWRRAKASSHDAQVQGVHDQVTIALVQVEAPALPAPHQQLQDRHHESTGEHQHTPAAGRPGFHPTQAVQSRASGALVGGMISASRAALAVQHQHHRQ